MTKERKENVQYVTAISFLFSGIVMCFIAFFLHADHVINNSVLFYLGESIIFTASVFGIDVYIRQQVNDAERRINDNIVDRLDKIEKR